MNLTPWQIWLVLGLVLWVLEVFIPLPTLLFAGAMGIGAMLVAILAWATPTWMALHIAAWMVVSLGLVWFSRRFLPRDSHALKDAVEARTLTEILPGQGGRVQYEGASWRALCDDPKLAIAANEKVYVLRRQGTTLIVVPEVWLQERG